LTLTSTSQNLAQPVSFDATDATGSNVGGAQLRRLAQGAYGTLTGSLNIDTPPGQVSFDVNWPLGSPLWTEAETAAELGISLPLVLTAASSNLTQDTRFQLAPSSGASVSGDLRIDSTRDRDGLMTGILEIVGAQRVDLNVVWPLKGE
jgi:hypothetical protein